MKKEEMLNNMMVGNGAVEKGGNKMLQENKAVRSHCLHCNTVLTKKDRKFCDRDCYNASRKSNAVKKSATVTETVTTKTETAVKESLATKAPVSVKVSNDTVAFEKALCNMQKFGSRLTLHRLKKLIEIAGERAHVIRVGGGVAIYWVINNKGYTLYYAPGKKLSYKESDFKEMKTSIEKLVTHKTFKDAMSITEYVELAEQMKGGE